jgi:uncharacterized membrane protein
VVIALFLSGALNLFLIGAAAGVLALGARVAHDRPPGGGPGGGAGQLWRASQALPPPQARDFRQRLRAQVQSTRPLAEAGRQARHDAWLTGAADPFNAAATKAALTRARILDQATRQRLEDALVDIAGALPQDQRRAVFRALADPPPPRFNRMRRGPFGSGPPDGPPPAGPQAPSLAR